MSGSDYLPPGCTQREIDRAHGDVDVCDECEREISTRGKCACEPDADLESDLIREQLKDPSHWRSSLVEDE